MKISRENFIRIFPALCLSVISLVACACSNPGGGQGNANAPANQTANAANNLPPGVRDDVAELNALVNFTIPPEETVWREDNVAGKGKKLLAVLKYYDGEDLNKIVTAAEKHNSAPAPVEVDAAEWFPEELTAPLQLSGGGKLKGNAYAANDFFNPPYTNGRLIRIGETNYFVLELTTF